MCKSFNFKKTLYDSSTVAQIAECFEPNTVLWADDTIRPSSFTTLSTIYNKNSSGDEIANVNFCAVHPEGARIR